ncbi:NTP pyrophosphohydrolase [Actinopolymorpha pittospori]|uniref:NTP pyrophosphohydrolase n=1 Tax=Actinopolymorpha pittospori TaxID=648752 RepID=A0A927N601_9ACTN|nr:NTP pyrophosphohydrolase [Actinopolymorpha pittospori]MBE1612729.1 hypothetical protein [Actinopolymorpha pittospori]
MNAETRPLLVVDAANVMGSVPDGWWHDRSAAAVRVRDALAPIAAEGRAGLPAEPPLEVVLVTEGAARGVESTPQVRVVLAAGSGDDEIVDLVRAADPARRRIVVTADRGLRSRVRDLGAEVVGPRTVYP